MKNTSTAMALMIALLLGQSVGAQASMKVIKIPVHFQSFFIFLCTSVPLCLCGQSSVAIS